MTERAGIGEKFVVLLFVRRLGGVFFCLRSFLCFALIAGAVFAAAGLFFFTAGLSLGAGFFFLFAAGLFFRLSAKDEGGEGEGSQDGENTE